MDIENFKAILIRDKQILKQLYSGPNVLKNKRILLSATDNELKTILSYLYYVVTEIFLLMQKILI